MNRRNNLHIPGNKATFLLHAAPVLFISADLNNVPNKFRADL